MSKAFVVHTDEEEYVRGRTNLLALYNVHLLDGNSEAGVQCR